MSTATSTATSTAPSWAPVDRRGVDVLPLRVGPLLSTTYDACRRIGRCVVDVDGAVRASVAEGCQQYRLSDHEGIIVGHRLSSHSIAAWVAVGLIAGWLEAHPAVDVSDLELDPAELAGRASP